MTKLNEFVYNQYEGRRDLIHGCRNVEIELKQAYNKINKAFGFKGYEEIICAFENEIDNMSFIGYKQGYKDGMRFLVNMVSTV